MAAGKYSFLIEQGATLKFEVQYLATTTGSSCNHTDTTPNDLTGYSGRLQIRPSLDSSTVIINLSSSLQADGTGLNFSGSNGVTPPTSGSIGIYISAVSSSALDFTEGVYDLEIESPTGFVVRLLEGNVKLSKQVTR